MKLLIVLQCAYGKSKKHRRQMAKRELWLRALWRSHTGRRLLEMLPKGIDLDVINSTPEIGKRTDDVLPPDPEYVRRYVVKTNPDVILGCGKVAQGALDQLKLEHVAAPHPAWRGLSREKASEIKERLTRILEVT